VGNERYFIDLSDRYDHDEIQSIPQLLTISAGLLAAASPIILYCQRFAIKTMTLFQPPQARFKRRCCPLSIFFRGTPFSAQLLTTLRRIKFLMIHLNFHGALPIPS